MIRANRRTRADRDVAPAARGRNLGDNLGTIGVELLELAEELRHTNTRLTNRTRRGGTRSRERAPLRVMPTWLSPYCDMHLRMYMSTSCTAPTPTLRPGWMYQIQARVPYHLEQSRVILQPERNALFFTVRLLSGSRRVAERGRDSGCAHEVSESSATASCSVAVARSSSISTFVSISDSESSVFCLSHNAFPHLMSFGLSWKTLAWSAHRREIRGSLELGFC